MTTGAHAPHSPPWDIHFYASSQEAAERILKQRLSKMTKKHAEIMTPIRVWINEIAPKPGYIYQVYCKGFLNGVGAEISAMVKLVKVES